MDVIEVISGSSVVEVFETSSTVIEILMGAKGDPGPSGAGITVNGVSPDGSSNITLTKTSIGLANVDNTSDANKPISSATATALAGKAATSHSHVAADVTSGVFSTARLGTGSPGTTNYLRGDGAWTVLAKADVGLSNVDNTSDANKPVSSATQTALNLKANLASPTFTGTVSGITAAMVGASATGHTHAAADIASGVIATARLGTGTANSTTYLRGDGTWATVAGGGGGATALSGLSDVTITSAAAGEVLRHNGTSWVDAALTKADVGLNNVDNTSDAAKPVSSATQTALNAKANDNAVMHTTGDETFSGVKTFLNIVNLVANTNIAGSPVLTTATLGGAFRATTPATDATYGGYWSKVWSTTLSTQYSDSTAIMRVLGVGSGSGTSPTATIMVRLKQQTAMGTAPSGSLYATDMMGGFAPDNFVLVVTENSASATTAELWIKAPNNWEAYRFQELTRDTPYYNVTFTYYDNFPWQVALPAGLQFVGTSYPLNPATTSAIALKANDNAVVHLAGTETVSGAKSFSALANFNLGLNVNGANLGIQDSRNIDLGSTNGTKIGTGTGQKLGFFNATPTVQRSGTEEIGSVIANLGLRAFGTAYTISTSGAITFSGVTNMTGPIRFGISTVTANAAPNLTTSNHQYLIDATSNAVALTLPATTTSGHRILAKRIDSVTANAVTVVGTLIDGFGTTYTLPAQWDYVELVSTTTSGTWRVVGASRVGAHDASAITSGTLSDAILPTRLQGLSGPTIVDANAATANGYYRMISGADTNVPISNFRGVIHVLAYNATYGAQEAYEANTGRNWVRTQTNGVWTAWRENFSESRLPTKTEVGLGNVDNTSDANKPVSTATQTALNLKANISSPIFSGVLTTVNTAAANDAVVHSLTASLGADATLGSLQVAIGGKPSATAANRYGYIFAADGLAMRPLALNFNGTGYGNVGIGTSAPTERLEVVGNIKASGSITGATLVGAGSGITALNAANLASGTVPTARLGSGTASATTYLRGDGTWATPAGGGSSTLATLTDVTITTPVAFQVLQYDGTKWLNGNLDYQLRGTDQNIYYNTGSSTYPVRTSATYDTQRRARWIGPVAPTIGGSYAIQDFDIWEKTA